VAGQMERKSWSRVEASSPARATFTLFNFFYSTRTAFLIGEPPVKEE
jgi:hypothetical protein